ncbi:aromatic amino acid lyase, partial [Candidatus Raskinella chloraquaticus]
MIIALGDRQFSCRDILSVAQNGNQLALSAGSRARISAGRAIIEQMAAGSEPIYGVNTGLGGNLRHRIPAGDIEDFQTQIIFGRMIGVGPALDPVICRAILLCRLIELSSGATGVSLDTIQLLVELFNRGVTPVIPSLGSIGASDIGVLAHLAAVVIGHGEAWFDGERMTGGAALAAAGLQPARLREKDGIGLINHAAASATLAAYAVCALEDALLAATAVAALSYEGYAANPAILDPRLHAARPAGGQEEAAAMMRRALAGSSIHEPGSARYV